MYFLQTCSLSLQSFSDLSSWYINTFGLFLFDQLKIMDTFNKAYRHLQAVAGILDELLRHDGILREQYVPSALNNFRISRDPGFQRALRCENFMPHTANISSIDDFLLAREEISRLLDLHAVPYPDFTDKLRDLAVTATALFLVDRTLYVDVPGFERLNLYLHRSTVVAIAFRNVMFFYFDAGLTRLVHEIHSHTVDHAKELGYRYFQAHQVVTFEVPTRPVPNLKNSFFRCD